MKNLNEAIREAQKHMSPASQAVLFLMEQVQMSDDDEIRAALKELKEWAETFEIGVGECK